MQCGRCPKRAVGDPDRADAHLDPQAARALPRAQRAGADRVRAVRVAVRVAPRPALPGDRQLALEPLVVGLQLLVGDRPVGGDAVAGADLEVGGVKARGEAGVVDHRAADAAAAVVLAELDRVLAADHPRLGPVELVRAGLVGDPVLVGVPERPGLQHEDPPASAREALGERRAAGAGADDQHVDRLVVACSGACARALGRRAGAGRAGTPSRSRAGAARPSARRAAALSLQTPLAARRPPDQRRTRAATPSARAVRRRDARSRAGRPDRRSRSRSMPTGCE